MNWQKKHLWENVNFCEGTQITRTMFFGTGIMNATNQHSTLCM